MTVATRPPRPAQAPPVAPSTATPPSVAATTEPVRVKTWRSRGLELAVALLLVCTASLVITDSVRVGKGWAADGPQAGYFPFYIGLGLGAVGLALSVRQAMRWRHDTALWADATQLRRVGAMLWPMLVYVALIESLGLYLPSAVLIGYFMRQHGQYSLGRCLLLSLLVVGSLFGVFELWFQSPLPKGPLEHGLGF